MSAFGEKCVGSPASCRRPAFSKFLAGFLREIFPASSPYAARDYVALGATMCRKRVTSASPVANRLTVFGNPAEGAPTCIDMWVSDSPSV